jgi:hypothetical protein
VYPLALALVLIAGVATTTALLARSNPSWVQTER